MAVAAIAFLEEPLIVALEFEVQNDSRDAGAGALQPVGGLYVRAIELRVVGHLARLHDPRVVGLPRLAGLGALVAVEQLPARRRQGRKGTPIALLRANFYQALPSQLFKITMPPLLIAGKVARVDDAERAEGREDLHLRGAEVILMT